MKTFFLFCFLLLNRFTFAQADSIRNIEPGRETSFENYEVLALAILGLLLLIGLRFWFRRTRRQQQE